MSVHPTRRTATLVGALATGLFLLAGCTGDAPDSAPVPTDPPTPLASYDTSGVTIVRAPYCDRVDEAAVEEALGGPPRRDSSWDNGDPVRLADGTKDVAHEYGCSWSAGPASARTWLFAPPVSAAGARDAVEQARASEGCEPDGQAAAFGTPSLALVCADRTLVSASYRGLFGDAWLVCEVTGEDAAEEILERAGRWCVAVAEAARTS